MLVECAQGLEVFLLSCILSANVTSFWQKHPDHDKNILNHFFGERRQGLAKFNNLLRPSLKIRSKKEAALLVRVKALGSISSTANSSRRCTACI